MSGRGELDSNNIDAWIVFVSILVIIAAISYSICCCRRRRGDNPEPTDPQFLLAEEDPNLVGEFVSGQGG